MEELAFWRNIAITVLGVECLLLLVVALAANYLLMRLMNALHGKTAGAAAKVQQISHTVAQKTDQYADKAVQPVLAVQGRVAKMQTTFRSMGRSLSVRGRSRRVRPLHAGITTIKE